MRSKIITLCRGRQIDIFNVPENFEELIVEDFKAYTDGTNHDYTYVDKLGFIDRCIERIIGFDDDYNETEDILKKMISDHFEYSHEIIEEENLWGFDTMVQIYRTARERSRLKQYYGSDDHHEYDLIQQLMCRIIKAVMNFEWESKNAE